MAKSNETTKSRSNEYDSRLIIYRSRQISFMFLVGLAVIGFGMMILQGLETGLDWGHLAVPLIALGGLFCLYPPTEEWEYKPWQSNPRKVEQNFDR